jgi:hypothetical protein
VGGAFLALQFTAMPVAELGIVPTGGPACVAAAALYLHCVLLPFVASFKLKPRSATAL